MQASALALSDDWVFQRVARADIGVPRRAAASSASVDDGFALTELAGRAGYRIEKARAAGQWLLIDTDGELARTPVGGRSWSPDEARRRLEAVTPHAA